MNREGLSLKVRSGVRTGRWRFPIAVERVIKGEALDLRLRGSYRLADRLSVSAGYTLFDERNLQGARLTPSLENGSTYHGVFVRLSALY